MRIVAGEQRGRRLVAPKGQSTRPTADRTRQALFNVVEHAAWSRPPAGLRALDLFAGSGALGFEAVSRGAAFCLFVDNDAAAVEAIGANIDSLRLRDRCEVRRLDATRPGRLPANLAAFDLAFLDPPYGEGRCEAALPALLDGGWLAPDALAVVERGGGEPALSAPGYRLLDNRQWGAARVWFLRPDR
jgi:16S rRNA (guanine966-N2)-methyltransferase